ncbi:unnamed protein product, partial [Callosobruchus maculatus]
FLAKAASSCNIDILQIRKEVQNVKHEIRSIKNGMKLQGSNIKMNLERIFNLLRGNATIQHPKSNNSNSREDLLQKYKFPLSSIEEISKLDKNIRTCPDFKAQLITLLSTVGGTSGTEDGVKVAYKIIDFLFKPEVLVKYSWTGVSRGDSGEKTSFQVLEGILTVCFDVVLLADSRHTKQKNANIFKERVLKHAKKRSQRKR